MKFIGLDCGWFRKPFEPLTVAQYKAYAKRFAALGICTLCAIRGFRKNAYDMRKQPEKGRNP